MNGPRNYVHKQMHAQLMEQKNAEIERLQPYEDQTRHLERRIRDLTEQLNCLKLDRHSHETLEHDVWCPMGSPSLTCTCAERGSQKAGDG